MGLKTKIQLIKRKKSEQYYINFPSAIAQAMEFNKGDDVEWLIKSKNALTLRKLPERDSVKKTPNDY